ncbi:MAG: choice-of-anchor L domain-containing protein [Flavobacteriales bacterium]
MTLRYILGFGVVLLARLSSAQLAVDNTLTPLQLVQDILLGGGVTVSNVSYNGVMNPGTAQTGTGAFTSTATNLGLDAGVILSSGEAASAAGPAINNSADQNGTGSDVDLEAISGGTILDRAVLEFDFIPTGDSLKFRYVFASEEYPEYVCSFNDVFGFFLSGPGFAGPYTNGAVNIALIPFSTTPVGIDNVNNGLNNNGDPLDPFCPPVNSVYYVDNAAGTTVVYDGMTVVLEAFALVVCGQQYHIKLAIGDFLDMSQDSGVFLEAGSFTSTGQVVPTLVTGLGVTGNTMLEGCNPVELVFTRLGDTTAVDTVSITLGGTATPNVDYSPAFPTELIFPIGQLTTTIVLDVPIDPDGPETIEITVDQLIECSGQQVQTTFTFNIDSPPPLDIVANDLNSVCGQSNLLAPIVTGGMGQYSYLWSTGETTASVTVSPGVTTTYTLTVSDVCGVTDASADITITLPIYPPLEIAMDPPTEIDCLGTGPIGVVSVTGGNSVFDYAWTVNGAPIGGNNATITVPAGPPTWYIVTVTEGCGTSIQDSVLVSTVPLPAIEITTSGDVTVICRGDSTLMEVVTVTGGNGVYTLDWTGQDGTPLTTQDNLEVGVPVTQTYTITAEDQCDNIGTATITTFIPVVEPFTLTMPADMLLCAGDSTELHPLVTGGSGYYYALWSGVDSLTDPLRRVLPEETTEYVLTVTDQCGEQLTDDVTVEVEHVSVNIVETNLGQDDWYLQAATLPYARTWVWDMGDSTRYRGDEVHHSYMDLEEHWVTLKITTPNGCEGMDSLLIKPPAHIYFPNAFSPDGDGVNDFFGPLGHYIEEFEMTVFDRWGEQVFTTTDVAALWDGSVNGSTKGSTGVYVYTYRVVGHYFPAQEGVGHVTLLSGSQD